MRVLFLFVVLIFLINCQRNVRNEGIHRCDIEIAEDSSFWDLTELSKPVNLSNGSFYKFKFASNEEYVIEWGNKQFTNISRDTFRTLGDGVLNLKVSNSKYIILDQGSGQRCHYAVVLPLAPKQKEIVEDQCILAYDSANPVLAYAPGDPEYFFILKNYSNGKELKIKEPDLCPATNPFECIDSCYFKDSYFIVYWQGSKWENKKPDNKMRKIKIPD